MPLFQSSDIICFPFQGRRAFAALSACPWLLHSRAFGAQESDDSTTSTRRTSNLNSGTTKFRS